MKRLLILVIILFSSNLTAQLDASISALYGYYSDKNIEIGAEGRFSIRVSKEWFITPSVAFASDGINFQTFPKLGITKNIYNRKHNWNQFTVGAQAYDFDLPAETEGWKTTRLFEGNTWKLRPFVRFSTPIFKLFKNRNNGAQRDKLLTMFVVEATDRTFGVGLGFRKRI